MFGTTVLTAERKWKSNMKSKKKNALLGRYPSCDMLNNALRFIRDGKIDIACEEIIFAIEKADGYFHEDIISFVQEVRGWSGEQNE